MRVEGDSAGGYTAVRLDSLESVEGTGKLLMADTDSGEVVWTDKTGATCKKSLGANSIRLIARRR